MKCFAIAAPVPRAAPVMRAVFPSSQFPDGMEVLECRSLKRAGDEGIECDGIGMSVGVIEASSLIRKDLPTIETMFLNLAERVAGQGLDDV